MLKLLSQPEIKTKEDIQNFFKARNVSFQTSHLKKELYRQLGISELLEPIDSVSDMAHKKRGISFFIILQSTDFCLKYQFLDSEVKFKDGRFTIEEEKLKKGFYRFNGDEICSFLEYCFEDDVEFTILSSKRIDKGKLLEKVKTLKK